MMWIFADLQNVNCKIVVTWQAYVSYFVASSKLWRHIIQVMMSHGILIFFVLWCIYNKTAVNCFSCKDMLFLLQIYGIDDITQWTSQYTDVLRSEEELDETQSSPSQPGTSQDRLSEPGPSTSRVLYRRGRWKNAKNVLATNQTS